MPIIEHSQDIEDIRNRLFDFTSDSLEDMGSRYGIFLSNAGYGPSKQPNDCTYYRTGHTNSEFIVIEVPQPIKLSRRQMGKTILIHTFKPVNEDRLFPVLGSEETFSVKSVVMDDFTPSVLRAVHSAYVPQDQSSKRDYAIENYVIWLGFEKGTGPLSIDLTDLEWEAGTDSDIQAADITVASMIKTMRAERAQRQDVATNPEREYFSS